MGESTLEWRKHRQVRGQQNKLYESMIGLGPGESRPGKLDRIASGVPDWLEFD